LPPHQLKTNPSSANLEMENLVSLSFIWHRFHVSVMFHSNNIIILNPTTTFGTHCV
jgi:hypothetical protein